MKHALGEAAVVAEAEVDDRLNHPLDVAAVVAEAEVDDRLNHPLDVAAAVVAEAEIPSVSLSKWTRTGAS